MFDHITIAAVNALAAIPDPGHGTAPPGFDRFTKIVSWMASIALGMCVLGFLVAAGTIAISHRHGGGMGDHGSRVGTVMAACVLIGSASGIVKALA